MLEADIFAMHIYQNKHYMHNIIIYIVRVDIQDTWLSIESYTYLSTLCPTFANITIYTLKCNRFVCYCSIY